MTYPSFLNDILKVSDKSGNEIRELILRQELPKGHYLFREGELCRKLFFIEKGIARIYFNQGSKEVTASFSTENSFLVAIDSFSQNIPTRDNCELLEPSIVYSMDYTDLDAILRENPEIARIAFYIVIKILKQFFEYITDVKFQTAKERFEAFLSNHPSIVMKASLGSIASYLGITQETLSRIRAQK